MKIYRWFLALALLFVANGPALAQWQVPNHAVPLGRGAGVTGFIGLPPGPAGTAIISNGPSADPSYGVPAQPSRVVTAAGAVSVTSADYLVIIRKTVGAATTVNLPAGVLNQTFVIKDGKGDAFTNNITVTPTSGTIDNKATYVINIGYGAVTFTYDGTQWVVL